jgi:cell wall-associated protease
MIKNTILVACAMIFGLSLNAQVNPKVLNWYNGGGSGMQTDKAYKKLRKRSTETVIVAVIDSGVDVEHEDLAGKIWVNADEIAGNGIDDDNNGFIDDVHGWNFLGNTNGENVDGANLEKTRIFRELDEKFADSDGAGLTGEAKEEYDLYTKVKAEITSEKGMYTQYISYMDMLPQMIAAVPAQVAEKLGKEDYTEKDLDKWEPEEQADKQLKSTALAILSGQLSEESIASQKKSLQTMLDFNLNPEFDERKIIGDNPNDFSDTKYGNNNYEGPDAFHGTHVSGIIAANRGNGLGGDGVATDVKIMVLRAVPNGDEADKDIALAVRYAADNGAQIINMSFGKGYSPHAQEVYEAFKYAESKDVLVVHAAGNDGSNLDNASNFPTSSYSFQTKPFELFLTIGSSTRFKKGKVASSFSNYSSTKVDIFAPGSEIYNTTPNNEYKEIQGTSMACPMVAGVAAMLKSYFPTLTMKEIKNVILETGTSYAGKMHIQPGGDEEVDFATLSTTGKVVNVKNAVKACKALEKAKNN